MAPEGYAAEPSEVAAVLESLVGEPDPQEDALSWYTHLSSRQALLTAAAGEIGDQRTQLAARIYDELGEGRSYAKLAEVLRTSRSRAQQLIERSRARDAR